MVAGVGDLTMPSNMHVTVQCEQDKLAVMPLVHDGHTWPISINHKRCVRDSPSSGSLPQVDDQISAGGADSVGMTEPLVASPYKESETKSLPNSNDIQRHQQTPRGYENWKGTLKQAIVPFCVSLGGSISAGLLLDYVKEWEQFKHFPILITLVPPLLGLKGNIEMTVTARLCTDLNRGKLSDLGDVAIRLRENLSITQFQATLVSLSTSILTLAGKAILTSNLPSWNETLLVTSSAAVTASSACLCLGIFMCGVVYVCGRLQINPDNVAPPLASSIGDISTLGMFSLISLAWFHLIARYPHLPVGVTVVLIVAAIHWGCLVWKSDRGRNHVKEGWWSILVSMAISLVAGGVLDQITESQDLSKAAAYVPVVNGVCGNLLSILSCRITTQLSSNPRANLDIVQRDIASVNPLLNTSTHPYPGLIEAFRVLLALSFASHLVVLPVIAYFTHDVKLTVALFAIFLWFVFWYTFVMLLLTIRFVLFLSRRQIDPDVTSIPVLTATADVAGTITTCMIFAVLVYAKDRSVT